MEKQSFVFYKEWRDAIQDLPDDVRLEFYEAVIGYALTGELRGLKPMAGIAFNFVRPRIDRDKEEYQSIIERNRGNGMLGGRPRKNPEKPKKPSGLSGLSEKPRETQRNPKNPDHDNDHEYDYDNEKEQKRDTDVSPESPDSFRPLNPDFPEKEEPHPPVAPPPLPKKPKQTASGFDMTNIPAEYIPSVQMWLDYKRGRGQTYKTQKSFELMVEQLLSLSRGDPGTAEMMVKQSMANNWAGLFELKTNGSSNGKNIGRQVHEVITDPRKGDFSDDI